MIDRFASLRSATARALLDGPGTTDPKLRHAVAEGNPAADLRILVDKIRARAYTVTDGDLDALRGRYNEDQLFEVIIAAAFGAAEERRAAAWRALEQA